MPAYRDSYARGGPPSTPGPAEEAPRGPCASGPAPPQQELQPHVRLLAVVAGRVQDPRALAYHRARTENHRYKALVTAQGVPE